MSNMERFEASRAYWSEVFDPQTKVERHLMTLIAFQDLLMQRSMTAALSATEPRQAVNSERRQNDLIVSIDRLVQVVTTVQRRRVEATLPPDESLAKAAASNVIEMPKRRSSASRPHLEPNQVPALHPFGPSRATEPRKRGARFALKLDDPSAA